MKLAKKMLACVMALAMVAVFGLVAFAAAPTISVTAPSSVQVGDTVTVTVSATSGFTGCESGAMYFTYDSDALEFVSLTSADNGFLGDGGKTMDETPTVSFAFMFSKAATVDSSALCTITFKALKTGSTTINYTCSDFSGVDTPAGGSVTVNVTEVTTKAPDPTPAPVDPVDPTGVVPSDKNDDNGKTTTKNSVPKTGATASVAVIAGVMTIAAVAFVATRKKEG